MLSDGTHVVTASVTDAGGLVGSASITVVLEPAGGGQTVTVASLADSSYTINKNFWKAAVVATIDPTLSGAVVSGTWSSGASTSCTTDTSGKCTVSLNVKSNVGSITFTVSTVTLAGYEYVPGLTSVTVTKPWIQLDFRKF